MVLPPLHLRKSSKITCVFIGLLLAACGDSTTNDSEAENSEETSQAEVGEQDDAAEVDDSLPEETPTLDGFTLPTWATCRQMFLDETLDESSQEQCDDLYLSAPLERLYGIRFIMISHPSNEEQWLDERLSYMKSLFEPEGIQFATKSVEDFSDSVVSSVTGESMIRLGDAAEDIAQFLNIEMSDEDTVIGTLIETLRAQRVSEMRLNNMSPDLEIPDAAFWRILARADSEHITLVVTDAVSPGGGFGSKASPPPVDPSEPTAGIIYLYGGNNPNAPDNPMVMAHEMGHYFGLFHTFEQPDAAPGLERCAFDPEEREIQFSRDFSSIEPKDALLNYWNLEESPTEVYVGYNVSSQDLEDFEAYRKALTFFGTEHHFSYQGQGEPILSNAAYWEILESNDEVYVKNFIAGNSNNCDWSDNDGIIGCDIEGDFTPGTDPLLDGTVVFQNGSVGNLMSYISPSNAMGAVPHDTLHNDQYVVNRITSHSASHQALRNYALK